MADHWPELSYPLPPVDPELVKHFRAQAAKSAHHRDYWNLFLGYPTNPDMVFPKYKDDSDISDDESVSLLRRSGLLSPSPSPSLKGPPRDSLYPSPNNTTTNQSNGLNKALFSNPATTSPLHTTSNSTRRIIRQAIVAQRITRSCSRPTTTFLALNGRGQAVVIDSVLSTSSRPARIQRRRHTKARKIH